MQEFTRIIPGRPRPEPGPSSIRRMTIPALDAPRADPVRDAAAAAAAAEAALLAAARQDGETAGHAAGLAAAARQQEAAMAAALGVIGAALPGLTAAAEAAAAKAAEALAALLLAALGAALPVAAGRLAPDCAATLVAALRPVLADGTGVTIFVAPGLAAPCAERIGAPQLNIAEDSALAPGDVRAEWAGGGAEALLAQRWRAADEVLAALGLTGD